MSPSARRPVLYAALILLFLLHNDLWLWTASWRLLGLPVGLTYHVLYCVAVTLLMSAVVRYAWPRQLASDAADAAGEDR